jgi:hypothetical protein
MRRQLDRDAHTGIARRVEQPQFGAALIDDTLAVGLCVACVEIVVVGVAPDVAAIGAARVEVADAVGIG